MGKENGSFHELENRLDSIEMIKRYVALITQVDTGDPEVQVLENTFGAAIVWSRDSQGQYEGNLEGAFTEQKTAVLISLTSNNAVTKGAIHVYSDTEDTVTIQTYNSSYQLTDDRLWYNTIEIRVYP